MKPSQTQISKQAVETWSEKAQIEQTKEELEELIEALNRFEQDKCNIETVIEEMAKCDIMISQCKHIFGIDAFNKEKTKQLYQLKTRVETGNWPTETDTNE